MVTQIKTISSNTFYPYFNLALEKYLFDTVDDRTVILYLWQNDKTVVYGSNQNVWKEVQVSKLIDDGGFPVRRLSGGGAVFHDKGNLNFTFLTKKDNYNVDKQLQVIIEACRLFGLTVEKTGRGDLTIEGRKFSDSAFYRSGERCCHHGTLLVNTDISMISRYLNADRSRPESNGVRSVEPDVADLVDFCPSLDIETMRRKLFEAFEHVYGLKPVPMSGQELEPAVIGSYEKIFSDDNWLFGGRIKYKNQICKRFDWGEFDLNLNVDNGTIAAAQLYSDADDEHFIASIGDKLEGMAYSCEALTELVRSCCTSPEHNAMAEDICGLLLEAI
ncbi:MAG: lipoate--protein ligase [Lachnospiraceae bacterium]|nr:lipoate--protein ligase [Lachnospiraceae bacterium]MDY4969081.1 lipoate--protein ligase [Lachnospiraceae bacterium]